MSGISPIRSHFVGLDSPTHKKWVTAIEEFYAASKVAQKCLQEMKEGKSILSYDLDSHSFTKNQFLDPSVLYYENGRLIEEGEKYYCKQWRDDHLSLLTQKVAGGTLLQFLKTKANKPDTQPLPVPQALDKFLLKILENRVKSFDDKKTSQLQKVVAANNVFKEKEAKFLQCLADFEKEQLYTQKVDLQLAWEQAVSLQIQDNISKLVVNYFADLIQRLHAQAKPAISQNESPLLSLFSDIRFHPQVLSRLLKEIAPRVPAELHKFIALLSTFVTQIKPFETALLQAKFERYQAQQKADALQGKTAPEKLLSRPFCTQELIDALDAFRPAAPNAAHSASNHEPHFWEFVGSFFALLVKYPIQFLTWLFQSLR